MYYDLINTVVSGDGKRCLQIPSQASSRSGSLFRLRMVIAVSSCLPILLATSIHIAFLADTGIPRTARDDVFVRSDGPVGLLFDTRFISLLSPSWILTK
jgi:hypothetical protein